MKRLAVLLAILLSTVGCAPYPVVESPDLNAVPAFSEVSAPEPSESAAPSTGQNFKPEQTEEPTPEPTPEPPVALTSEEALERADEVISSAFTYNNLVDLAKLSDRFIFDITYASENNFLGVTLYDVELCLAHIDAARLLLAAQYELDTLGLRLIIHDIYRPAAVQERMYELTPDDRKKYVAKPGPRANHTKGVAVDCSLAFEDGTKLEMPSGYDELTSRASASYTGGTEEARENRDLLIALLKDYGLEVNKGEWWHFNISGAADYPVLDTVFDDFITAREHEKD